MQDLTEEEEAVLEDREVLLRRMHCMRSYSGRSWVAPCQIVVDGVVFCGSNPNITNTDGDNTDPNDPDANNPDANTDADHRDVLIPRCARSHP